MGTRWVTLLASNVRRRKPRIARKKSLPTKIFLKVLGPLRKQRPIPRLLMGVSPRRIRNTKIPSSSAGNNLMTAEQWKAQIQAQQDAIASLQSQIDKLNASIHFVEANRYYNGVQYNQHQLKKQEQVQQMQKQLEEQKKKLEDMQEGARKAGFGNAV